MREELQYMVLDFTGFILINYICDNHISKYGHITRFWVLKISSQELLGMQLSP